MPKILFTKSYPPSTLDKSLGNAYNVTSKDFITTEFVDIASIKEQISKEDNQFIVTSLRATKHIEQLGLQGEFYCVGEKSANFLKNKGKQVVFAADDAASFLVELENRLCLKKSFIYFCSDIRKDKLPNGVRHLGHQCKEIITYKISSKQVEINNVFNAYVFFSPSGVKSFAEQYGIPKKAVIFAIGETTGKEVNAILNENALIPDKPNLKSLIETIKAYFDAKK